MRLLGRIFVAALAVGLVGLAVAHAQPVADGPTSVVMTAPAQPDNWGTLGDVSWPAAAYAVVSRFLSVLERMVTDTRAWLDRVLDITKGRLKVDLRKTVVTTYGENDPDRTGPIPRPQRRRDDPGRNGTSSDLEDDEDH